MDTAQGEEGGSMKMMIVGSSVGILAFGSAILAAINPEAALESKDAYTIVSMFALAMMACVVTLGVTIYRLLVGHLKTANKQVAENTQVLTHISRTIETNSNLLGRVRDALEREKSTDKE